MENKTLLSEEDFKGWLEHFHNANDGAFEVLQEATPFIFTATKTANKKDSILVLHTFLWQLNLIKNGILDLCETDNLHSAKILCRSFIECWLKEWYIFLRFLEEGNDDAAHEYLKFCSIEEDARYGRSVEAISKILGLESVGKSVWDILTEIKPELKVYGKDHIIDKAGQFEYKKIIRYLSDTLYKVGDPTPTFIHNIIPAYSELSTFVHSGPNAIKFEIASSQSRFSEYQDILELVFTMYQKTVVFIFSAFHKELGGKFFDLASRMQKIKL